MEKELYHNRETFLALLGESADIKKKTMYLGLKKDVGCFLAYVEITGGNFLFENSVVGKIFCIRNAFSFPNTFPKTKL